MMRSLSRYALPMLLLVGSSSWALDAALVRTKVSLSSSVAGHVPTKYTFNGTIKNVAGADVTVNNYFIVTFPEGTDLSTASGTLKTTGQPQGLTLTFGTDGLNPY